MRLTAVLSCRALSLSLGLIAAGCIVIVDPEPESAQSPSTATELGASVIVQPASAEELAPAARVLALGREDNRVQEHLRHLCLTVGPRLTRSHGLMEAERWCRDQLAAWGLDARLERWGEFPVGFDRGHASGAMMAPQQRGLVFTTPAWTPGTDGPVRGPALMYPSDAAALDALRPRLERAWIVRPSGQRPAEFLKIRGIDVEIYHCNGHKGVYGNELSDLAAKNTTFTDSFVNLSPISLNLSSFQRVKTIIIKETKVLKCL